MIQHSCIVQCEMASGQGWRQTDVATVKCGVQGCWQYNLVGMQTEGLGWQQMDRNQKESHAIARIAEARIQVDCLLEEEQGTEPRDKLSCHQDSSSGYRLLNVQYKIYKFKKGKSDNCFQVFFLTALEPDYTMYIAHG